MKRNAMVAAGFAACLLLAGPARRQDRQGQLLLDWVILLGQQRHTLLRWRKGFSKAATSSPGSSAATARPPGSSGWLPDRQIFCSRILAASSWRERTKAFAPRWLPSSTAGTATPSLYLESSGIKSPADLLGQTRRRRAQQRRRRAVSPRSCAPTRLIPKPSGSSASIRRRLIRYSSPSSSTACSSSTSTTRYS